MQTKRIFNFIAMKIYFAFRTMIYYNNYEKCSKHSAAENY